MTTERDTESKADRAVSGPNGWDVYALTGREQSGGLGLEEIAAAMLGTGVRVLQLREKRLPPKELEAVGRRLALLCRPLGVALIVNDDPALAVRVGAAGAHIGQEDMDPCRARDLLGPEGILGCSTHNVSQVERAVELHEREGCRLFDYIAFGPLFGTTSKERPDPETGLEIVRSEVRGLWHGPLVGIGGITRERLPQVAQAGIDIPAVIGAAMAPTPAEIQDRVAELRKTWLELRAKRR